MPSEARTIRYVALGDSFSEGVGDDSGAMFPGWAGRLASALAATSGGAVEYANLAIRGRLFQSVLDEQLPAALEFDPAPTLVTFCAGGNNLLRRSFEPQRMIDQLEVAAELIRVRGATLALVSPADPSDRLPMGRLIRRRGDVWAEALSVFARRRHLPFVNVSRDTVLRDEDYWAPDRLHLNALGHRRVAELALYTLRDAPYPVEARTVAAHPRDVAAEMRYLHSYVLPWVIRRLSGRSSGDSRTATHPSWTRVPPLP